MLDRTGDTCCNIKVRSYGLTCLSNLTVSVNPSGIDTCSGRRNFAAQFVCQIFQHIETFRSADTTSAGYKDLSFCNIHRFLRIFNNFTDLDVHVCFADTGIKYFNRTCLWIVCCKRLHNARTNSCHLRTEVWTNDRCHDVSTECRTGHHKTFCFRINLQFCTVGCQAGMYSGRYTRCQITANCCCTVDNDFRFFGFDYSVHRFCVRFCGIFTKYRSINCDYLVCAMFK